MIRINLLPPEYEAAQARKEQQFIFGTSGGLVVVLLLLFWGLKVRQAAALEEKIAEAEADLRKYQTIVSQIEQAEADKQRLSAKRDVIRTLNRSRLVYPVFFEDFLPIVPSDVWVTSIQITEQGGQMKVAMAANALSNFALATWLTNLQQSTHFSGVELGPIAYAPSEAGPPTLNFNLGCFYQHQGPFPLAEYY